MTSATSMDAVLAIDAGNSRVKWGVASLSGNSPGEWLENGVLEHHKLNTLHELCLRFPIRHAVVSNVAGTEIRLELQRRLEPMELDALWVTATQQSCGVANSYKVPHLLGSDRWAALIAAWDIKHAPCVVVNAGTAITVDVLSTEGVFMGGLILPGLKLMKASLAENTADLEIVSGSLTIFPQNTGDAMYNGAMQAISGAVVQMYDTLAGHEGMMPHLLLSGGDALILQTFLADKVPVPVEIVEHLVLDGLILIHKEKYL